MATCFCISPIGKEGSEIREHADDVWKFIIDPALKAAGIRGYRADHMLEAGRITDQMYRSILGEDFCIAILTYHNPNVFYEVAIAQSAGKPVIMMILKGAGLPFDVHNSRVIEYDLRPTPIFEKVYERQLSSMIASIQQTGWRKDVPFGLGLSPLGGNAQDVSISAPAEAFIRSDDWLQLIRKAQNNFEIVAYGLTGWPVMPQMRETLMDAARRGCRIRILTYSSENQAFVAAQNWEKMSSDIPSMGARFESVRKFFHDALQGFERCEVRAMKKGMLFQQLVFSDDEAIAIPYSYSADTGHGALIKAKAPQHLFTSYRYEFDTLWNLNDSKIAVPDVPLNVGGQAVKPGLARSLTKTRNTTREADRSSRKPTRPGVTG